MILHFYLYPTIIKCSDRREEDKIYFDEFLHALTAFNLFTNDEMVMFVFKMFDRDRDDYISKKDVFRHLMLERDDQMVFPVNNLRAVELFKCERGDRIDRYDIFEGMALEW